MADLLICTLRQRLLGRRDKIAMTLKHIQYQRLDIERNKRFHDESREATLRNALNVLDQRLHEEFDQVEKALNRVDENRYGVCFGCGASMDPSWLTQLPESEYCRACQDLKHWVESGLKLNRSWRPRENPRRWTKREVR